MEHVRKPGENIPDVALDQLAMDLGNPAIDQVDLAQRLTWAMINQARTEQAEKAILQCNKDGGEILFIIESKEYPILSLLGYDAKFIKMVLENFRKEGFTWESGNKGDLWIFAIKIA